MKSIILATLGFFFSITAHAGDVYRCGNTYTDSPCSGGRVVALSSNSAEPSSDDRAAAITRYYEGKLHLMAVAYSERELELTKAYLSGSRVTQITNVTASAGAYAGASTGEHRDEHRR